MIDEKELESLVGYRGGHQVLSLYLDTDLMHRAKEAVKLTLRDLVKNLGKEVSDTVQAINKYVDFEYDWQARGLAIFSAGDELWKTIPLPVPVKDQASLGDRPDVRTLVDVLDRLGKYDVALIDRESVRLFSVSGGRIVSETEAFGEELKRHKQGGWAAARYQRHEDNLALHNLKQAVEVIQSFCEETSCQRLMLAGSVDVLAQVKELLPRPLQDRVIGEFVAEMNAAANDVLARSADVVAQADLAEEQRLVEEAITAAAKGGAGVIGLADTLSALHQGRARRLLVEESYQAAGYVCGYCGYVSAEPVDRCPFCGREEISETPDVVSYAISKAIETHVPIDIVRQNEPLIAAGGIAALLRY